MAQPHGRDGLSAWRTAVLWTFREPSLCRRVHRALMRNALLDYTPIIPVTACHQSNYVETYSRSTKSAVILGPYHATKRVSIVVHITSKKVDLTFLSQIPCVYETLRSFVWFTRNGIKLSTNAFCINTLRGSQHLVR